MGWEVGFFGPMTLGGGSLEGRWLGWVGLGGCDWLEMGEDWTRGGELRLCGFGGMRHDFRVMDMGCSRQLMAIITLLCTCAIISSLICDSQPLIPPWLQHLTARRQRPLSSRDLDSFFFLPNPEQPGRWTACLVHPRLKLHPLSVLVHLQ